MSVGKPTLIKNLANACDKWYPTERQLEALTDEAKRRGYFERWDKIQREKEFLWYSQRQQVSAKKSWRHEVVTVRGYSQDRYRDLKTGRFIRRP
jgi:hypothetical protein